MLHIKYRSKSLHLVILSVFLLLVVIHVTLRKIHWKKRPFYGRYIPLHYSNIPIYGRITVIYCINAKLASIP